MRRASDAAACAAAQLPIDHGLCGSYSNTRRPIPYGLPTARPESADSLQTDTAQIAVPNRWVTDAKKRQNRAQTGIKVQDSASGNDGANTRSPRKPKKSVQDILAKTKLIKQLLSVVVIGGILRLGLNNLGWHPPSLEKRLIPALVLWMIFGVYWGIAGLDSAPTRNSESWASTYFHQFLLCAAFLLLILPVSRLNGWFLPQRLPFVVAVGATVQAGFFLLAVWARRHLGRNWSAEVRIATDHQLVRTGPYRLLRHPIYTAMLGMFLGTTIA
jgi:hypothetical protein